jgi:hypothetical protein
MLAGAWSVTAAVRRMMWEPYMNINAIIHALRTKVLTGNRIRGIICLMLSGPFIGIGFLTYTIAVAPFQQLIFLLIGLSLGAAGTFLLISPDEDEN